MNFDLLGQRALRLGGLEGRGFVGVRLKNGGVDGRGIMLTCSNNLSAATVVP